MIDLPLPIFTAITVVLVIGFISDFNKYIRFSSLILYIGFWFSFNSDSFVFGTELNDFKSLLKTLGIRTVGDFLFLTGKLLLPFIIMLLYVFYMKRTK